MRAPAEPLRHRRPTTAIDNCYVVGLHTSLARLEPCLAGHPVPWDWDAFAVAGAVRASAARRRPRAAHWTSHVTPRTEPERHAHATLVRPELRVSTDGYGAGEGQSLERPFGHANPAELSSWAGATAAAGPTATEPGGTRGFDDYFTRDFANNIGAEIMGRNKFGPQRGPVGGPRLAGLVG